MANNWFYAENNQKIGPFDEAKIMELAMQGKIQPDTLVWHEKMLDWQKASKTELARFLTDRTTPLPPSFATCSICHGNFSKEDVITIAGLTVCSQCKPLLLRRMQEGDVVGHQVRYAGFWIRFLAKFIDGLILQLVGLPITIIGFILPIIMQDPKSATIVILAFSIFSTIFGISIGVIYNAWFLVRKNATPGKMVLKLKVINADGTEKISAGKAIGRYFAEILSGLLIYIGYIMAAFDEEKRALHDRICATRVIHTN